MSNSLKHWGVMGMHWGVRRAASAYATGVKRSVKTAVKIAGAGQKASYGAQKYIVKKGVSNAVGGVKLGLAVSKKIRDTEAGLIKKAYSNDKKVLAGAGHVAKTLVVNGFGTAKKISAKERSIAKSAAKGAFGFAKNVSAKERAAAKGAFGAAKAISAKERSIATGMAKSAFGFAKTVSGKERSVAMGAFHVAKAISKQSYNIQKGMVKLAFTPTTAGGKRRRAANQGFQKEMAKLKKSGREHDDAAIYRALIKYDKAMGGKAVRIGKPKGMSDVQFDKQYAKELAGKNPL